MEPEPIAIVGMSAVLPGPGSSIEGFWDMICRRQSARTEVPGDRFNIEGFHHPNRSRLDSLKTRHGHFIQRDLALFNAAFFTTSPAEAACMDPQSRILLETTYRALENAGITMDSIAGTQTSVFVAGYTSDYTTLLSRDPAVQSKYQGSGYGAAYLSGRISHFFDLRGPNLVLDTACSSSGYALHLACQSIRNGESESSIVAGGNIILSPESGMLQISNSGFLSPDGICYSFDARANGYARGEGFAAVVLKPLSKAVRDGDTIRSIIRATGVNQDGRTPSITQPSALAQETLIKDTYARHGLDVSRTGFFEAHGTGTQIGDRMECSAIGAVFRDSHQTLPLIIGSVKANVGHLEGTSGFVALIKATLSVETGLIPPNVWLDKVNPDLQAEWSRIHIPREITVWPVEGLRRVSVNNFGFGGSNSHIIIDDAFHYLQNLSGKAGCHVTTKQPLAPEQYRQIGDRKQAPMNAMSRAMLYVLSASDRNGTVRQAKQLETYFSTSHREEISLDDLAYTLAKRRTILPWRSFSVFDPRAASLHHLTASFSSSVQGSTAAKLALVFTGQGAKSISVDEHLLELPEFKHTLNYCQECLQALGCQWKLMEELQRKRSKSELMAPTLSQSLTTCLQVALVDLLASWGVRPGAVLGHSSGEIAGAYAAGLLTRDDAVRVAFLRGKLTEHLMASSDDSAMLAIAASRSDCEVLLAELNLGPSLAIGCTNSPSSTTLTGSLKAIETAGVILSKKRVAHSTLPTGIAYHSSFMAGMTIEYKAKLGELAVQTSAPFATIVPFFSSVTGELLNPDNLVQADYWVRNLTSEVKFHGAFDAMLESHRGDSGKNSLFVAEIGPYELLKQPIIELLNVQGITVHSHYQSMLSRGVPSLRSALIFAGQLFSLGGTVDVSSVNGIDEANVQVVCNLPEYPFDHTTKHWWESRLSLNYRQRRRGRHELLGLRAHDWNPIQPLWRNVLSLTEMPWMSDHKFRGSEPIYPAGGCVCAAIEAMRDYLDDDERIRAFRLRNIQYLKSIPIDSAKDYEEWQVCLRRIPHDTSGLFTWHEFTIYSLQHGEYVEACRGEVRAETEMLRSGNRPNDSFAFHESTLDQCTQESDFDHFYRNLWDMGFEYGPSFRLLRDIRYGQTGEAAATIGSQDWIVQASEKDHSSCIIHPTLLDALFQMPLIIETHGGWQPSPMLAASSTSELLVSADITSRTIDFDLSMHATSASRSSKQIAVDIAAFDTKRGVPLIFVTGHTGTKISDGDTNIDADIKYQTLAFNIDFKPAIALMNNKQVLAYLGQCLQPTQELLTVIDQMESLSLRFYKDLIADGEPASASIEPHLHRWLVSMKSLDTRTRLPVSRQLTTHQLDDILRSGEGTYPAKQAVIRIGHQLKRIFAGETTALEILFGSDLADRVYAESLRSLSKTVATFVDLLAHENANLRVIEVGGGTGSVTAPLVNQLLFQVDNAEYLPRFSEYTFTDISAAFLEPAMARFSHASHRMSFKTLDISRPLCPEQFSLGTYDVLLAASVLHATPKLLDTLRNCRKLLKPGGRIILLEPCNLSEISSSFIFGLVPGWWASEDDFRQQSPIVSEATWNRLLMDTGFSGVDFSIKDRTQEGYHGVSMLVSTATDHAEMPVEVSPKPVVRLLATPGSISEQVGSLLQSKLTGLGVADCSLTTLADQSLTGITRPAIISLLDLDEDFLSTLSKDEFDALRDLSLTNQHILWISKGAAVQVTQPSKAKMLGFGRATSAERGDTGFVNIAFSGTASMHTIVELSTQIFFLKLQPRAVIETEYYERNNRLEVRRLQPAVAFNSVYRGLGQRGEESNFTIDDTLQPEVHLTIRKPGLLDTLQYVEKNHGAELQSDEILVQVRASSLNFADVLVALGNMPDAPLGWDFAGEVISAGPHSSHSVGDHVLGYTTNSLGTYARCNPCQSWLIPKGMSFDAAASIFTNFATAWYSLVHTAQLSSKDSILIQAGAGGVGQAAIQIARHLGVTRVFVTVGSNSKRDILTKQYGIPGEHIFNSRNESFTQKVLSATQGRGVDVILNSVSGELLQQTFLCLAPLGRMVEIGKRDILNDTGLKMRQFLNNVTYSSVNLVVLAQKYPQLLKKLADEFMPLFASSEFHEPRPLHVFSASEPEAAFRQFQKGQSGGKVVLDFSVGNTIQYVKQSGPSWRFDPLASYIVVGGFGGLGRATIKWACTRGAKCLVILSRSGANNRWYAKMIDYAATHGVRLLVEACDITDSKKLQAALSSIKVACPQIKGCFNSSMIIKDALLENMSYEAFIEVWRVKADGAWNLLQQLPADLDFHIQYSSCIGVVGAGGQSNYIVGSVYQDALAHYAASQGKRLLTLNLGVQLEAGFVAESSILSKMLLRRGFSGISVDEFLRILEVVCEPGFCNSSSTNPQLVLGIDAPHTFRTKGLEPPGWMSQLTFSILGNFERQETATEKQAMDQPNHLQRLTETKDIDKAISIVTNEFKRKLARTMMIDAEEVDTSKPGFMVGIDSLIAVELRTWFSRDLAVEVSVFDILQSPSILSLCKNIAKQAVGGQS